MVETRLKHLYPDFRTPMFFPDRVSVRKIPGPKYGWVFVVDMGDMFGDWVKDEWIKMILEAIRTHGGKHTTYLFLTKNPKRYFDYIPYFTSNMMLGATIETDKDVFKYPDGRRITYDKISKAPKPLERLKYMYLLPVKNKFISIEPILDFNLYIFADWIHIIKPKLVYVGYDNYNNHLPEPSLEKTMNLINYLRDKLRIEVREKTIRPAWWENKDI